MANETSYKPKHAKTEQLTLFKADEARKVSDDRTYGSAGSPEGYSVVNGRIVYDKPGYIVYPRTERYRFKPVDKPVMKAEPEEIRGTADENPAAVFLPGAQNEEAETIPSETLTISQEEPVRSMPASQTTSPANDCGKNESADEGPQAKGKTAGPKKRRKRRLKKGVRVFLVIAGVLLAAGISCFIYVRNEVWDLKSVAYTVKDKMFEAVDSIMDGDTEEARLAMDEALTKCDEIEARLEGPLYQNAARFDIVNEYITSAREMISLLRDTSQSLIYPAIDQFEAYPEDKLRLGSGQFSASTLAAWLDFAQAKMPEIRDLVERVSRMDLSLLADDEDTLESYMAMLDSFTKSYDDIALYIPVLETILASGEDRYYLFVAQNSAEIRACGGFPGSVGTIRISDGVLTIGDFSSVVYYMKIYANEDAGITAEEKKIFSNWLKMARDAEYIPDFRRVAEIWTSSHEEDMDYEVHVDGIISLTPAVIQKLLALTGEEYTLSDGTVLNGENATYVLQYELYFKYYSAGMTTSAYDADELFTETARLAMNTFTSSFSFKNIISYFNIWDECVKDRTLLIWMRDEEEEQIVIDAGCGGVINGGEDNAVAGVYFSNAVSSKLGWWAKIETEATEGVRNEDGSTTYQVSATFTNTITTEEVNNAAAYIIGENNDGTMQCHIHLFAPVGGTIDNIATSNGMTMNTDEYQGVQVAYYYTLYLKPQASVTITYTVTTAAGVDEPLTFSKTPTLQE